MKQDFLGGKKVLLTGGKGFIGSHVVEVLRKKGIDFVYCDLGLKHDPNYVEADVNKPEELERVFKKHRIGCVIHLAAEVGRYHGEDFPEKTLQTNIVGTMNVIKKCIEFDSRLVFASSSEAYGHSDGEFLSEDLKDLKPITTYGLSKLVCEKYIELYREKYGLKAMIYRFFNAYGAGEKPNYYRGVVANFIDDLLNGRKITVHKGCYRTFTYVSDLAENIVKGMENFQESTFNIGTDQYISIEELAKKICNSLGKDYGKSVNLVERGKFDVFRKRPNIEKSKKAFGLSYTVSMDEGLKKTIDWQKQFLNQK